MTSAPPSGWCLLKPTSNSKSKRQRHCPKLFYNFSAAPEDGFTLFLTDLIALWRCSVSRDDVIDSAGEQHTSIDPSEGTEQMRILLDKLALALHNGTNKLAKDGLEAKTLGSLILKTAVELPKPLKPLEWTFSLAPQPASKLAEHVLRPTLRQSSTSQQKIESMLAIIKEKDHVIERLLDRVAEKGVDMSLIFPTLTGTAKRGGSGVKVDDAKRLVPGMKAFQRGDWEKGFKEDELAATEIGISELVKGFEKCFAHSEEDHNQAMGSWLQKLPSVESLENGVLKSFMSRSQSHSQSQRKSEEDTGSEIEFETQDTPPRLSKKRPSPDINDSDGSGVVDKEPVAKRVNTGGGKIGALGRKSRSKTPALGKQASASSSVHSARSSLPPKRKQSDASTATDSASESENKPRTKVTKQSLSRSSRLGGLKPSATKSPQFPRSSSPPSQPQIADFHASHPKELDRIGETRQKTASPLPKNGVNGEDNEPEVLVKSSQTTAATPSRKLGGLGLQNRNKNTEPSQAANDGLIPASPPPRTRQVGAADESDATASASPSPPPSKTSSFRSPTTDTKGKPDDTAPERHSSTARPARPPTTQSSNSKDSPEPKPEIKAGEEQEEEETEVQKAARRRLELKRNIQSGGAKKKRRF